MEIKEKLKEGNYTVKDHMDVEVDFIKEHFKNPVLQAEILKENEDNVMAGITGQQLKEHEADIIKILEDLPSAKQEINWLKQVHGLTTLSEIGLDENLRTLTLKLRKISRPLFLIWMELSIWEMICFPIHISFWIQ